ncbi:hypothetical protein HU200_013532 [Digitaria exilis]|uniref:Uncharacterized protein n=1 Tax=Digitaria exilis TaxID=1010633 RepID=A0A835FCX3_9POAL|nr:hypothetical protein HU200_013532 [Digitaria exilis]
MDPYNYEAKQTSLSSPRKEKTRSPVGFLQRSRNALLGAADAVRRVAVKAGRARGKSKWRVVAGCNWPDFEGTLLCACWVRINLKQFIGDIDNAAVACGLGRAIGNKCLALLLSFSEEQIIFTFIFLIGYDSSEKKRIPAWCDRILYRDNRASSDIECSLECPVVGSISLYDSCMEATDSDHKPVKCVFNLDVAHMDKQTMRHKYGEIMTSNKKVLYLLQGLEAFPEVNISTNGSPAVGIIYPGQSLEVTLQHGQLRSQDYLTGTSCNSSGADQEKAATLLVIITGVYSTAGEITGYMYSTRAAGEHFRPEVITLRIDSLVDHGCEASLVCGPENLVLVA